MAIETFESLHTQAPTEAPKELSIIVPAYNEGYTKDTEYPYYRHDRFVRTLDALQTIGSQATNDFEVVVVNDGSTDNTAEVARKTGVKVIGFETNQGKGAALSYGIEATTGLLWWTDADGSYILRGDSYDGESLLKGLELLYGDEADIVTTVRGEGQHDGPARASISKALGRLCNIIAPVPGISDTQAGHKGMRREVADDLFAEPLFSQGFGWDREMFYKAYWQRGIRRITAMEAHMEAAKGTHVGWQDGLALIGDARQTRRSYPQSSTFAEVFLTEQAAALENQTQ